MSKGAKTLQEFISETRQQKTMTLTTQTHLPNNQKTIQHKETPQQEQLWEYQNVNLTFGITEPI